MLVKNTKNGLPCLICGATALIAKNLKKFRHLWDPYKNIWTVAKQKENIFAPNLSENYSDVKDSFICLYSKQQQ